MQNKKGFQITDGKGFHITFSNGVTVSVQFGYGNYCENHDISPFPLKESERYMKFTAKAKFLGTVTDEDTREFKVDDMERDLYKRKLEIGQGGSSDAEVAVFTEKKWITDEYFHDGDAHGYLTADEIPDLLVWAKNYDLAS